MIALFRLRDRRLTIVAAFLVISFLIFLQTLSTSIPSSFRLSIPSIHTGTAPDTELPTGLQKPNVTVSGLVFYGRKSRVSSMRCYLEQNLVDNGGWLDEVLWIVNTQNEEDLAYLDEVVASYPARHKLVHIIGDMLSVYTYYKAWEYLERGKYYVKIDDDIVWIEKNAIPRLVTRKVNNPNDFVVSANIINNPPLGFLHYHMGAVHPYFPELAPPENISKSWRPSHNPYWQGSDDYTWPLDWEPPYDQHRWLRVKDDKMLAQSPASELKFEVWGESYSNWAIATQMHYSLFENIEKDQLSRYMFNKPWNMDGERIRINFMCVYADDILDTDISSWPRTQGDEDMIVITLPRQLRRPVMILGDALGAHFQYADQGKLGQTDVLSRYQAMADQEACSQLNHTLPITSSTAEELFEAPSELPAASELLSDAVTVPEAPGEPGAFPDTSNSPDVSLPNS